MANDIYSTDSGYYLGRAVDAAAVGDFFRARSNLIHAMWAAREDANSVIEEAKAWAEAVPVLEEIIRLNRERLDHIAVASAPTPRVV